METTARRNRVINSNWDISVGLENFGVNATLESFLTEPEPHMLYSGAHLCPVPKEKSPGRKHFNTPRRRGSENKTATSIIMPAGNKYPS